MAPIRQPPPVLTVALFALLLTVAASVAAAPRLHAQQQERGLLERIQKPDRTLAYSPASKKFEGERSVAPGKSFVSRPFVSSRSEATTKSFRSRDFAESKRFRTRLFASSDRDAAGQDGAFTGRDRAFAARAVDTREARDAQKALPVREAISPGSTARPFLGQGKRQAELDDQSRNRQPLTVEEVRQLLNKPR